MLRKIWGTQLFSLMLLVFFFVPLVFRSRSRWAKLVCGGTIVRKTKRLSRRNHMRIRSFFVLLCVLVTLPFRLRCCSGAIDQGR